METFEFKTLKELASYAIDKLNDRIGINVFGADLHNEIFNTDYYIIGYYQAEQWLIKNTGVFNGIGIVQDYEKDNFGEVTSDLSSSENVCNMVVYIAGEEVLQQSETLQENWNNELTEEDCNNIVKELKEYFNL